MTIDHSYPYQHEWHLAEPIAEHYSSVPDASGASTRMIISVWVCQCGALKRHVTRCPKMMVYDPEGLQDHDAETAKHEIELVNDIP